MLKAQRPLLGDKRRQRQVTHSCSERRRRLSLRRRMGAAGRVMEGKGEIKIHSWTPSRRATNNAFITWLAFLRVCRDGERQGRGYRGIIFRHLQRYMLHYLGVYIT